MRTITIRRAWYRTKRLLSRFGIHLDRVSLEAALSRCRARQVPVQIVIDIGASNGSWSLIARRYFPRASYYLIEANSVHLEGLQKVKQRWPNFDYIHAAAGDSVGEIYFDGHDPLGGLASKISTARTNMVVPVITVDHAVQTNSLKPPYLLKLDTHGFEVPIFEGAAETLKQTSLIIVETYNFDINPGSLKFYDMCKYMEEKGFRCVDMCDPGFRLKPDKALWQFDLFFMQASHSIFQDNSYR